MPPPGQHIQLVHFASRAQVQGLVPLFARPRKVIYKFTTRDGDIAVEELLDWEVPAWLDAMLDACVK